MRVIALDTSGSIPEEAIKHVMENRINVGDYVLMFDTKVYPQGIITSRDQISSMKLMGFGGTLISVVLDYIDQMTSVTEVIIFTDGYFYGDKDERLSNVTVEHYDYRTIF